MTIDKPQTDSVLTERLKRCPNLCPCCQTRQQFKTSSGRPYFSQAKALDCYLDVRCEACGYEWQETYTFDEAVHAAGPKKRQNYLVKYAVYSLAGGSIVAQGETTVNTIDRRQAVIEAQRWAEENDSHFDDRIEPQFVLLDVAETDDNLDAG
jgi:hypothetical protein